MRTAALALCIVLAVAAHVPAQETGPSTPEERLADARAKLEAGQYAEAAQLAGVLARSRDESLKTEAMTVQAEALRKGGDWRIASKTYADLAKRFDPTSPEAVRYEAIAEVLRDARAGRYPGVKDTSTEGGAEEDDGPTLSDDAYLEKALKALAPKWAAALQRQGAALRSAKTSKQVVTALEAVLDGYARVRVLDPEYPRDAEGEAVETAAAQMDRIGTQIIPKIRDDLEEMEKIIRTRQTLTNAQIKVLEQYQALCRESSEVEPALRDVAAKCSVEGARRKLNDGSLARQKQFGRMAFVITRLLNRPRLR